MPVPYGLRRAVAPTVWGAIERLAEQRLRRTDQEIVAGPVHVAGLFSESHGIAASAIRCAEAMEELGLDTRRVDLGKLSHLALLERPSKLYPGGGAWIVHANAPEFVTALATIGARAFTQALLVGYWAWELPNAPPLWRRRRALADEIWAPSSYTASALGDGVRVVAHPAPAPSPFTRTQARERLGLPSDRFTAVTLFDFRSSLARKNPLGALDAFRRAFGDDEGALLIIKCQHGDIAPSLKRTLLQKTAFPNVRVIDEIWPSQDARALISAADVVLSLHRAEGFGLTLAEAMTAGTPVIATAWSGNLDFMAPDYEGLINAALIQVSDPQSIYSGQHWADPDIEVAARSLMRLRSDFAWRRVLEQTGRRLIAERLGSESYADSLGPAFWRAVGR